MTTGNGTATDLQGPLARMWRDVYRKAAQAAEARLQALQAEHVYHHHGRRALTIVVEGQAGGGDGGATDVTVTTDASLTATESPANTFALAVRLSPDAGNALSLHANGLYGTDTTGGGGTGNTTMYTQTSAPTGAANSLWFNPSETA